MVFQPHPGRARDLRLIAAVPKEILDNLVDRTKLGAFALSTPEFVEELERQLSPDAAEAVARFVVGIRRNLDSSGSTFAEYSSSILLEFDDEDLSPLKGDWLERSGSLEGIVESDFARILAKASELYYLHDSHLHEARIVTELRPILSVDMTRTVAQIIKSELFLTISDRTENEKRILITVGVDDLLEIREQIDRALQKVDVLRTECEKLGLPTRVYGEADYDGH